MVKEKALLKHGKAKARKAESTLDTAEDCQAAGVDLEEAAGKHRAGDPIKSMRFFQRALDMYGTGLTKFPTNFDLAYNKARIQYEIATHPKLVNQLDRPLLEVLRAAFASHEYALQLNENDADVLFNTSQVLTSIAELLASTEETDEAIRLLQFALDLQARCFSVQELRYKESQDQLQEVHEKQETILVGNDSTGQGSLSNDQPEDSTVLDKEQWASVIEPVTMETLVDTIVACTSTMTTLCTVITSSQVQSWKEVLTQIENQNAQVQEKYRTLSIHDKGQDCEVALADAILMSALLDAAFVLNNLPALTYQQGLENIWSTKPSHGDLQPSSDLLFARADAWISFNASLSVAGADSSLRWAALASVMKSMTTASKISSISAKGKSRTHFLRGDISLLQYRMSMPPNIHQEATANAMTLLTNAQVYYHNAANLSTSDESREKANFRYAIAQNITGMHVVKHSTTALKKIFKVDGERMAAREMQEMMDEGLILEKIEPDGQRLSYL